MQRAEKIKAFVEKSSGAPGSIVPSSTDPNIGSISELRLTPVSIDHFSRRAPSCLFGEEILIDEITEEQFYVLRKGGCVNGLLFPLWDEPPPTSLGLSSLYEFVCSEVYLTKKTERDAGTPMDSPIYLQNNLKLLQFGAAYRNPSILRYFITGHREVSFPKKFCSTSLPIVLCAPRFLFV